MAEWKFPEAENSNYLDLIAELPADEGDVPRRQHVVSRVILKGFAAPGSRGRGWLLRPFDVRRNVVLYDRGPKACAFVNDFIGFSARSAEELWQGVEGGLQEAIEAARAGELHEPDAGGHRDAITDAIALHYIRAPRTREKHQTLLEQSTQEVRTRTLIERRPLLEREFFRRRGLVPAGTEALGVLVDEAMTPWRGHMASGAVSRVGLASMFERIRRGLRGMPVEVFHAPREKQLLVSDNAAFTYHYSDDLKYIETNMAIGDSQGLVLPLSWDCMVGIGKEFRDEVLLPEVVDLFNELQIRNAQTHVYFRPGSGLEEFVSRIASRISR